MHETKATRQAEATRQTDEALAQAPLFGEHPDPAHDAEAMGYEQGNDLWEYSLPDMSKEYVKPNRKPELSVLCFCCWIVRSPLFDRPCT